MGIRDFLNFCVECWPLTLICGGFIIICIFGMFVIANDEIATLEHCQENGYETSFYRNSWYYCASQEEIAKIECVENKCYIFDKQKTEES